MKTDSGFPANTIPPDQPLWRRIFAWPTTQLGKWSVGLAATFLVLFIINSAVFMQLTEAPWQHTLLPFYGIAMLLVGLAAGTTGLMAVIRQRERSWLVWLTILPGLFVLFLLLGEFLVPH